MATDNKNGTSSPIPDAITEEASAEYSAELKLSGHSTGNIPRKAHWASSASDISNDQSNMDRINEALHASDIEDELSTPSPSNKGGSYRDSDFMYTDNSRIVNKDGEETNDREKAVQLFKWFRAGCGKMVNNCRVQNFIVICIAINAIMMGIGTYKFVKENPLAYDTFWIADLVFLIIFTIELLLQFIYHGPKMLLDGWLLFDLIVVIPSWVGVAEIEYFDSIQILRAFRIFRALRLVTRIKVMRDLIVAILSVMPRMAAIFLMLLLIFYIFAVMFTQLYSDVQYEEPDPRVGEDIIYFKALDQSMLTLFQLMTMDEWATVVHELENSGARWAWLFIIIFVLISGFVVVNLIVAVICDAIGTLSDPDKAKLIGRYDEDGSETTKMELREQIDVIEEQIGDLTRIQARTFHTLQYLTQQLQVEKERCAAASQSAPADENTLKDSDENKDKRCKMRDREDSECTEQQSQFVQFANLDAMRAQEEILRKEERQKEAENITFE